MTGQQVPSRVQVTCNRCGASFEIPEISEATRHRIADLARSSGPFAATRELEDMFGMTLTSAKGLSVHLTKTAGHCHRCHKDLGSAGQVVCANCRSLNIDW